jgi:hypothetical protein
MLAFQQQHQQLLQVQGQEKIINHNRSIQEDCENENESEIGDV